jgi:alkaline phosphatase
LKNDALNYSSKGEPLMRIWLKMKQAEKKAGCITAITITHASQAGFCVSSKPRKIETRPKRNSVGWTSINHSADYVELAMVGPGSDL